MEDCDIRVEPGRLRRVGHDAGQLAAPCRAAAAVVSAVRLPPRAFGGTKHGLLISRMSGEFARALHGRLTDEAGRLEAYGAALLASAATYEHCDQVRSEAFDALRRAGGGAGPDSGPGAGGAGSSRFRPVVPVP